MKQPTPFYLLQSFRGIAALGILLFHASCGIAVKYFNYNFLGLYNIGRTGGVDYFFVLTGFMMYYVYSKDFGKPEKISRFLTNRFIRIYPAFWAVLLPLLPIYFLVPSFGEAAYRDPNVILKSLLLYPQGEPILPQTWSSSYIFFFYLMFALLFSNKRGFHRIFQLWFALTAFRFAAGSFGYEPLSHGFLVSFLFNKLNLEFFAGCGIAALVRKHTLKRPIALLLIGLGLAGYLVTAYVHIHKLTTVDELLAFGLPSVLLIWGLASIRFETAPKWMTPLLKLGDASYSIYLTHLTFLSLVIKTLVALHAPQIIGVFATLCLCVAITIILGRAFYVMIEKPMVAFLKQALNPVKKHATRPVWQK